MKSRYRVSGVEMRLGAFDGAKAVNIGIGGVAVETQKYLEVGKTYPLRFRRPAGSLRLTGTVIWSQLTRTVTVKEREVLPVYRAGLEFARMSVAQKRELEEFIAEALDRAEQVHSVAGAAIA